MLGSQKKFRQRESFIIMCKKPYVFPAFRQPLEEMQSNWGLNKFSASGRGRGLLKQINVKLKIKISGHFNQVRELFTHLKYTPTPNQEWYLITFLLGLEMEN